MSGLSGETFAAGLARLAGKALLEDGRMKIGDLLRAGVLHGRKAVAVGLGTTGRRTSCRPSRVRDANLHHRCPKSP